MAQETRRVPALAPHDIPVLVCTECGQLLRIQVTVQNNRKLTGIKGFCDSCKYCFKMSTPHGIGEIVGGGYEAPNPNAQRVKHNIEIVGMSKPEAPAPQASNADDPRQKAPGAKT